MRLFLSAFNLYAGQLTGKLSLQLSTKFLLHRFWENVPQTMIIIDQVNKIWKRFGLVY